MICLICYHRTIIVHGENGVAGSALVACLVPQVAAIS